MVMEEAVKIFSLEIARCTCTLAVKRGLCKNQRFLGPGVIARSLCYHRRYFNDST